MTMQKILIACIVALLIVVGVIVVKSDSTLGETPAPEAAPAVTEGDTEENAQENETMAEIHEGMEDMPAEGTDIGMEFPIPDGEANAAVGETDASIDENAKVFNVTGKPFEFSMSEIRVQEGDTVTINFESEEGFHDWVVDEFEAATARVQAGGKTSVTFVADKKGEFEYYCSVGSHRQLGMVGTLIVE